MRTAIAAVAAVLVLVGCGEADSPPGEAEPVAAEAASEEPTTAEPSPTTDAPVAPTRLAEVARSCNMTTKEGEGPYAVKDPVLFDGDMTLVIDTQGKDDASGLGMYYLDCALRKLEVPGHVQTHIESTRALDGMQTNSWDGFDARWSYHPDSGMTLTVVDTQSD